MSKIAQCSWRSLHADSSAEVLPNWRGAGEGWILCRIGEIRLQSALLGCNLQAGVFHKSLMWFLPSIICTCTLALCCIPEHILGIKSVDPAVGDNFVPSREP